MLIGVGKGYSQEQTDSTTKVLETKSLNIDSTASSPSESHDSVDLKQSNSSDKDSSKTRKNSLKNKLSKTKTTGTKLKDKEISDNEKLLKDSAKKIPGGDIKQDVSNSKESLKTKKDDIVEISDCQPPLDRKKMTPAFWV